MAVPPTIYRTEKGVIIPKKHGQTYSSVNNIEKIAKQIPTVHKLFNVFPCKCEPLGQVIDIRIVFPEHSLIKILETHNLRRPLCQATTRWPTLVIQYEQPLASPFWTPPKKYGHHGHKKGPICTLFQCEIRPALFALNCYGRPGTGGSLFGKPGKAWSFDWGSPSKHNQTISPFRNWSWRR